MTRPVVVVGGSVAGLATSLALAGRGFRVRVLEQAPAPPEGPPDKAAELWERPTVAQNGHSHILTSLGVRELRAGAPEVLDAVLDAGGHFLDLMAALPERADDRIRRAGDDELVALAVRRPVFELVLRRILRSLPNVTISRQATVGGLLTASSGARAQSGVRAQVTGVARVTGVVTVGGEHVPALAVVDATGRRAASRSWLSASGLPSPPERTAPTQVRGFTRFYRLKSPGALPGPLNRGNAAGGIWDHYAAVAHPADNGTYALTLGVPTADPATNGLRDPAAFTAAARLSPHLAAWADPEAGEPIGPVRTITLPPNILRGAPPGAGARPVAGLFAVGDAACVTNPLFGRGMSLALRHAFLLAELLDTEPVVGERQAELAGHLAEGVYRPWYELSVREDAVRGRLWRSRVTGGTPPAATVTATATESGRPPLSAVAAAATTDGSVWRGLTRVLMGLDTAEEIFDDESFRERVRERVRAAPATAPDGPRPPSRAELLAAIGAEERV
ncbi:NAD(P)/FAD-dependent oxidoreductase [Streptomyces sp. NPDC059568]|uniref:NAD(P)/FAD-dependent oxidoreductase n=1 Tax=Streptomyces sp. NPDC059568 TaxID=3346868 RepID=UPI0036C48973